MTKKPPSAYTQVQKCFKNKCQTEKASFSLGDGPVKSTLFGWLADIFANNTVISPRQAKHASVCLLIPHKRTAHSFALIHKRRQTFPLFCRLLSFSFFYFPPSSLSPGRAHSYTHPGTSLEVFRPHTEQCKDLSLTLFLLSHSHCFIWSLSLYQSLFFIVLSLSFLSAWPDRGRVKVVCPCLSVHSSSSSVFCLSVCLNVLM